MHPTNLYFEGWTTVQGDVLDDDATALGALAVL